jgi:hypothetical protein
MNALYTFVMVYYIKTAQVTVVTRHLSLDRCLDMEDAAYYNSTGTQPLTACIWEEQEDK